jgi:phospholipase C
MFMHIKIRLRSRQKAIFAVAALALLAGLVSLAVPAATQAQSTPARRALATPARSAIATPIKHIVVLYQENESFDSVLGFYCDKHPGRCPAGGMPSSVKLSNGAVVTPKVFPDIVPLVNHNVATQIAAIDGGKMDGWENIPDGSCAPSTGYRCIGGYEPGHIPNLASLATHFAISDHTFSMGDSPSWGGHLYAAVASLDGFLGDLPVPAPGTHDTGWGCNHTSITAWISPTGKKEWVPGCIPDPKLPVANGGAFEPTPVAWVPSIFDRLDAAGLSWHIYDGKSGASFQGWAICPSLADCWDTKQKANVTGSNQFAAAAAAGKLPAFSIITPGGKNTVFSQHNGFPMGQGDNWIGQIANDLMNGPEWKSTVLFITYDDCGCFYDQVPPGTNPDGTQQGPRVPLVIVSPYAKPGYTDNHATTFAGILAYVEHTFGLAPLGANDAQAYPFTNTFNYKQKPLAPVPMVTRPMPPGDHIDWGQAKQDT